MTLDKQTTLKKEVAFSGRGIFSGKEATVTLRPAPSDHGIVFKRVDLPSSPSVPAQLQFVKEGIRSTVLGREEPLIHTVEHLLAALHAHGIDNVLIEMTGPEVPILDGSSAHYSTLLEEAGTVEQEASRAMYTLKEPVTWSHQESHLVALPAEEFRLSYTLHYPRSPYLKAQYYSYVVHKESFKAEIAPARTFTLYEEIEPLLKKGLLKEASLENGVVIQGDKVLNPEGVRFNDEMVRHKILDMIGDLSLVGKPFLAHIIAIRSGHAANHALGNALARALIPLEFGLNFDA